MTRFSKIKLNKKNNFLLSIISFLIWLMSVYNIYAVDPQISNTLTIVSTALIAYLGILVLLSPLRYFFLSPLYILGAYGIFIYAVLPRLTIILNILNPETGGPKGVHTFSGFIQSNIGSLSEAILIQFSIFLITLNCLLLSYKFRRLKETEFKKLAVNENVLFWAVISLIMALILVSALRQISFQFDDLFSTGLGRQIHFSFAPILSLGFTLTAFLSAQKRGVKFVAFISVLLVFLLVELTNAKSVEGVTIYPSGQIPLYISFYVLIFYWIFRYKKLERFFAALSIICGVFLITFISIGISRYALINNQTYSAKNFTASVTQGILDKAIYRQMKTGSCFKKVVASHLNKNNGNPFYFFGAVIPRYFWPNKPNLSMGERFKNFCYPENQAKFSELATLLAEPIYKAGFLGLIVAQLALGIALFIFTVFMTNGNVLRLIILTSLLPWLGHFQQHFGLFIANSVKMYLYMLPVIIFLLFQQLISLRLVVKSHGNS